ncbi:MAG: ATP-binding cassette domain-containing protein [Dehalococcoidia bacterium]
MNKKPLTINTFTKSYGSLIAVDQLSLEINSGEVFGFLGPNGAGKSTTIRTMMNFIAPSAGEIKIFGLDSVRDRVKLKEHVGYLAGDIALYGNMTGHQILNYLANLRKDSDWAYVKDLIRRLDAPMDRSINTLSKGNKQKIGLLQAFMHKPDLLILDEPTSGLDPLMKQVFYDMVLEMKDAGKAAFISSHDLTEVQKICDRAGFIRDGTLIAIENLHDKNAMNYKKYQVRFEKTPAIEELTVSSNIKIVANDNNIITFAVTGNIDSFIKTIAQYEVLDLDEQETSLEDVFMQYYERDKNNVE